MLQTPTYVLEYLKVIHLKIRKEKKSCLKSKTTSLGHKWRSDA